MLTMINMLQGTTDVSDVPYGCCLVGNLLYGLQYMIKAPPNNGERTALVVTSGVLDLTVSPTAACSCAQ